MLLVLLLPIPFRVIAAVVVDVFADGIGGGGGCCLALGVIVEGVVSHVEHNHTHTRKQTQMNGHTEWIFYGMQGYMET